MDFSSIMGGLGKMGGNNKMPTDQPIAPVGGAVANWGGNNMQSLGPAIASIVKILKNKKDDPMASAGDPAGLGGTTIDNSGI